MEEQNGEMKQENEKYGARNNQSDATRLQMIHDYAVENGAMCMDGKSLEPDEVLVSFGGEIKVLGDGKVGGYLVRFSTPNDPDLEQDFFTKDTDFGDHTATPIFYHHGMDENLGKRVLAKGTMKKDEFGIWVEAQLQLRDEYEKWIYERIQAGKQGWSSGTAGHLVEREQVGKSWHIKSWLLGLDASITPTPAEPRNSAVTLKSLYVTGEETDETPVKSDGQSPEAENKSYQSIKGAAQPAAKEIEMEKNEEGKEVEVTPAEVDYDKLAAKLAEKLDTVTAAKSVPAVPAVIKSENLGDPDPYRALAKWAGGGSAKGIGALGGKLINENSIHFEGKSTKAALQEASGEGAELVPDDFFPQIIAKRDQSSIARRAGTRVLQTSRDIMNIPVENASMANFAVTAEEAAYTQNEPTFATVAVTVYKFTKVIKVSEELLEDDATNLDSFLTDGIGRAWALTENEYVIAGTGSGQPQGLLYGGSVGYTFADTNSIAATEIPSVFWSLGDPYHDGAVWIMKGATAGHLQSLTGNNFQLVPTPYMPAQMTGDIPMSLWGKPVYLSDSMPAVADNLKSVLFANMNYYALVERRGLTISRNPYLYQANGQIGIFCSVRFGGAVLQSEAIKWGVQV
jgi:HK97 family phage major capsid protein